MYPNKVIVALIIISRVGFSFIHINLIRLKFCVADMAEYIVASKPLGGLIFLLPRMFSFENKGGVGSNHGDGNKDPLKNVLAKLEQILIHTNLPVSKFQKAAPLSRLL
jgi:hypothetical protein